MAINGNNILIAYGGSTIAATKSMRIQTESDTIEVSTTVANTWRKFIAGHKTWTASCDWLVSAATAAAITTAGLLRVGTSYALTVKNQAGTSIAFGTAICTRCTIEATRGALARGSFEFQGTGTLSTSA